MADVKVPYPEAGQAAFEELDTHLQEFLYSGSHPAPAPGIPLEVKADEVLEQFHVVGLDANDVLVPAVWNADPGLAIQAVGVCSQAVIGATGGGTKVPTLYTGCFNPDALVWDASFDTDGKKAGAFNGAPTPTTIVIRKRL